MPATLADKLLDFKWGNIDLWRSEEMQLVQARGRGAARRRRQGARWELQARGPPAPPAPARPPRTHNCLPMPARRPIAAHDPGRERA